MQQKSADQIMSALSYQQQQLVDLRKHQQTFAEDFASNVAGNALWSGVTWLISRLAKLV